MRAKWLVTLFQKANQKMAIVMALSVMVLGAVLLSGCGNKAYTDPLEKYRSMTAEQLFVGANTSLAKKHYAEAVKQFSALDAIYPFGKYNQRAQLYTIYATYKNNDMLSADLAAQRYIRLYPRGPHTDYAYYMSALANFSEGQTWLSKRLGAAKNQRDMQFSRVGYHDLLELTQSFPNSPYYHAAVLHMRDVRNTAAEKEFSIAKFYYIRKAYIATINRCNDLLVHIPNSSVAPKAIKLIIQSYNKLGLPRQAAYYQSVYTKTFA
jgi:outer membrane protein assembly factor BamD